jgi:hypothetical protein
VKAGRPACRRGRSGEILHAVQDQVHAGDGGGHVVALLAVEAACGARRRFALDLVQAEINMPPVPQVGS